MVIVLPVAQFKTPGLATCRVPPLSVMLPLGAKVPPLTSIRPVTLTCVSPVPVVDEPAGPNAVAAVAVNVEPLPSMVTVGLLAVPTLRLDTVMSLPPKMFTLALRTLSPELDVSAIGWEALSARLPLVVDNPPFTVHV